MSKLNVIDREGLLVVDSRLIAEELGIQHKNFLATLDKYIEEIEEDWGQVAFETETVETSGGKQSQRVAFLTEPQATLLMTYSRNTEQVRRCKRQLVKAFDKAKSVLGSALQSQVTELEQKLAVQSQSIASLQSQVQNLLPVWADFIPPGWDADVWEKLPPQDKRHFRFLYRRRGFRPGNEIEVKTLPALTSQQIKLQQRAEFEAVVGVVPPEELERFEALKHEVLKQFWGQGGES
ncbi:Rha family transcriptional regulator [Pelatocladus sp. BLCC-F211]|uniref:Rha family transcriptional regulator n=1 Tax=Pelatocladus sp. BLCC-F211 TaxID=3342752 RepID=UPI0035BA647F